MIQYPVAEVLVQQLEGVEHGVEHGGGERVATQASFVVETGYGEHLKIANIREHTNKLHRTSLPVINMTVALPTV